MDLAYQREWQRARRARRTPEEKERERLRKKAWRDANPGKQQTPQKKANDVVRKQHKRQTTPRELERRRMIRLFYKMAKLEAQRTGRAVEVDHIVPLKHPLVSGLHNEFNLQLLFAEDNRAKHNHVWPEMPT